MDDGQPILLMFHDDNGEWQFLSSHEEHPEECVYIHLAHVLECDPSVRDLEDLPTGWRAWRWNAADEWRREPTPQDQAQAEPV
jgi:hypothetical protein